MASQQSIEGIYKEPHSFETNLELLLTIFVPGTLLLALFILTYYNQVILPEIDYATVILLVFAPFFLGLAIHALYSIGREIGRWVMAALKKPIGFHIQFARGIYEESLRELQPEKGMIMRDKFPTVRVYRMFLETLEDELSRKFIKRESAFVTSGYESGIMLILLFWLFWILDWALEFLGSSFQLEPSLPYLGTIIVCSIIGFVLCLSAHNRSKRLDTAETLNLALNVDHFKRIANELVNAEINYRFL